MPNFILTPGTNYLFRLRDGYEFEAKFDHAESESPQGAPGALVVFRGIDKGFLNTDGLAAVWERPPAA